MKEVPFKDVEINQVFTLNDAEFKRIKDERVSCCRVLNAISTTNPGQKIQVQPLITVKIDDKLQ